MTTITKGFPSFEAENTTVAYDIINSLINDLLNEDMILDGWIRINGLLYVHWNPSNKMLTIAQRKSDVINDMLFEHAINRMQKNIAGKRNPEAIYYDTEEGKVIGIKYVGSSIVKYASFKVGR